MNDILIGRSNIELHKITSMLEHYLNYYRIEIKDK